MRRVLVCLGLLCIGLAAQRGGRGPRDGVFRTEVPTHAVDLVVGRPGATSAVVTVLASEDLEGRLEYAGRVSELTKLNRGVPFSFLMDGLTPDTGYSWRLAYRKPGAPEFSFSGEHAMHTTRSPGAAFTVTITADSHLDSNTDPAVYARTMLRAAADRPDFHVDLGDTFMTDKYPAYRDAAPQYLAQRYYFGLLGVPVFLALGNHDGEQGRDRDMTAWSSEMREHYFPNPAGSTYYAWTWGDGLFVVLDPFTWTVRRGQGDGWQWTLGEAQYRWLTKVLAASSARHKFVFIHHLVGGAESQRGGVEAAGWYEWGGRNAGNSEGFASHRPGWELPIHRLLVKYRVSAVFHGHDHLFAKQDLDGIVYQETPQPGFPEGRDRRDGPPRSAAEYGYASGIIMASPGYLRMRVAPGGVNVDFVRPGGEVVYAYSVH